MTHASERQSRNFAAGSNGETWLWRRWLFAFLVTSLSLGAAVYAAVVLIDPFSIGRFSLVTRIDLAPTIRDW